MSRPIQANANFKWGKIDCIEQSNYFESFLLRGVTSTIKLELDGAVTQRSNAYDVITRWADYPKPGTKFADWTVPANSNLTMLATNTAINSQGDGTHFNVVTQYEGSTGCAMWQTNGNLTQEAASLDNRNSPTFVNYVLPPAASDALSPPNTTDRRIKYGPRVFKTSKFNGMMYRSLCYYDAQPANVTARGAVGGNWGGEYAKVKILARMLGTVNTGYWGPQGINLNNPRTWLCNKVSITTVNSYLYKVDISWIYRQRTWDEVALYLDSYGTIVPGCAGFPLPQDFPTSTVGFTMDATSRDFRNGWRRFKMQGESNFNEIAKYWNCAIPDWSNFLVTSVQAEVDPNQPFPDY